LKASENNSDAFFVSSRAANSPKKRLHSDSEGGSYADHFFKIIGWFSSLQRSGESFATDDSLVQLSSSRISSLARNQLPEATAIREKALLLFLLDTGARISEALNLKMTNLHLEEGRALVTGKGAKERYVFIGKATKRALWRYISLSRPEPAPNVDRVFLTFQGRPLPYRRATFELQRLAKKSGIENVHPHRFRRTAAIQFLRNNGSLFALQKMLGHETLDMVRRYVELASDDVEQAHKTASPVDNWNL